MMGERMKKKKNMTKRRGRGRGQRKIPVSKLEGVEYEKGSSQERQKKEAREGLTEECWEWERAERQ